MSEGSEKTPRQGSLLEKLRNLPDGEDGLDENPYDLARRLQQESFDKRPEGKTTFKSFVDQTAGMRETNRRAKIRSRR